MKTFIPNKFCIEPDNTTTILSPHTSKRWGNAHVFTCENESKQKWVVKDCSVCHPLIRNTVGRFLFYREIRALQRLKNLKSIPGPIVTPRKWTLAYPYIAGKTLRESIKNQDHIKDSFFEKLEELVIKMHQQGVAHLDIRNRRNIIITPQNEPVIIDFQSAIFIDHLPKKIRQLLLNIDLSGVYKHWKKITNKTLTPQREEVINKSESLRKFWVLKGYPLQKLFKTSRRNRKNKGVAKMKVNIDADLCIGCGLCA
jgi:predicted Ser/Thr protein kinase